MTFSKFSKQKISLCLLIAILMTGTSCSAEKNNPPAETKTSDITTTDTVRTDEHEDITWDLITIIEHNDECRTLLEKSIAKAHEINPDPDSNPVDSLESYYAFVDRIVKAMPWSISPYGEFSSLYEKIDQGMGCLYAVSDQPLEELEQYGYYHNSILYHEPFRSWWVKMLSVNGSFLSGEESWNDEYYQNALANPDFNLDGDLYEDPSNWKSFNDFFARKLSDPSKRPVERADDPAVVVSPADAVPQGIWKIDENSKIPYTEGESDEIEIKTGILRDISVLLKGSAYADAFANGTITHTFLDINDYHRYHFPVSGTVKEVSVIPQDDAPGGVIVWDEKKGRYKELYSEIIGWQSIETRGVVIVEMDNGSLCAIVPVGMCQVSSVNFEESVKPGAHVKKGDPLGYFLFGGSDIIMIFSEDADFEMKCKKDVHILTGEYYGEISLD